jgi:hypothetical protein
MELEHKICPNCLALIVEDAQLAVRASAKIVSKVAAMLNDQPADDARKASLSAEADTLLEELRCHDEELSELSLALFQSSDPKLVH